MPDSIEMLKVEIYSQHSHGLIMSMLSFVLAFFISFSVFVYTSFYGKSPLVWCGGFILIVVFTFGAMIYIRRFYKRNLIKISSMIERIRQGEELPSLEELTKLEDLKNIDRVYDVSEVNEMSVEEEQKRDKLIYEIIVDRYDQEWRRTNDLDSKASNVTGFAGLLATLTAGITEFFPQAHYEWLFLIPLTFFIVSAILGIWAYWITDFEAINPNALIQAYANRTKTEVLRAYTGTTSKHTMRNYSLNQRKARRIYGAFILLVLAIGLFFVFSIINILM